MTIVLLKAILIAMNNSDFFSRLIILGLFIFISLIILVALIAEWSNRNRMFKASNSVCSHCKKVFGIEVFKNLNEQVKEKVVQNRFVLLRSRAQLNWKFNCPHCHSEFLVNLNNWKISVLD